MTPPETPDPAPFLQGARMTPAVWTALLAARDADPAPDPAWTEPECAAWRLYAPLVERRDAPFCFAQVGQSLDGRVATVSGDARDISGPQGLAHLHRCRALADAVVVGVRTALTDDPRLTVRLVEGPNPARVVIDPRGRLPNSAAVFAPDGARRIVIQARRTRRPEGVEIVALPARDGWIAPADIRSALAALGLRRVLIEGGGLTIASFLESGLLDRLHVGISPLIIGAGPSGLRTAPIARLADALRPETRVYGLETDVIFDCALGAPGIASTSQCPTEQTAVSLAARRA
jgi:riboflavin-specific deaminase-like protein